jgi:hypothetical protein
MSDRDPEPTDLSPEERALQERVAAAVRALPAEPPGAGFRAAMRERFVSGREPGRARAPRRPGLWFGLRPLEIALGSAAILMVASLGMTVLNAGPGWRVAPGPPVSGNVIVDDEPIPVNDLASLDESLRPESHIVWDGDGDLMLRTAGGVVIAVLPGTEVHLPAPPRRWFARSAQGRVERGEIRVLTGPRFHGAAMAISTPQSMVRITGTALAVICEPGVTCVCVYEGTVLVTDRAQGGAPAPPTPVPAGQRRTVFAEGRPTEQAEMRPGERVALGRMSETMRAILVDD